MVAGGVGLAPFATLTEALAKRGTPMTLFYGGRSRQDLFHEAFFERARRAARPDDRGRHARRTRPRHAPLERALAAHAGGDVTLYACGPTPMMRAVATLGDRFGRPTFVSLEPQMGCGMGGCYSCVVRVTRGIRQSFRPLVPRGSRVRRVDRRLERARRGGTLMADLSVRHRLADARQSGHRRLRLLRLRPRVRAERQPRDRWAASRSRDSSSTSATVIRRRASSKRRPACSTPSACRASASIASSPRSCPSCAGSARRRSSTSADRRSTSTARSRACSRTTRASARSSSTSPARTSRKAASSSAAA